MLADERTALVGRRDALATELPTERVRALQAEAAP